MTLEDFEKELAASKNTEGRRKRERSRSRQRDERRSHDHAHRKRSERSNRETDGHQHRHHHRKRHRRDDLEDNSSTEARHRYSRRSKKDDKLHDESRRSRRQRSSLSSSGLDNDESDPELQPVHVLDAPPTEGTLDEQIGHFEERNLKRDVWMETPSAIDVDYVQRPGRERGRESSKTKFLEADYERKIHKNEINHHLRDLKDGKDRNESEDGNSKDGKGESGASKDPEVSYTFGDSGSSWRMIKLRNVYRHAKESRIPVEEVAIERFGGLKEFDDVREEEIELDRRKMYGRSYVGKEKPSGELYHERQREEEARKSKHDREHFHRNGHHHTDSNAPLPQGTTMHEAPPPTKTVTLDATALNKLKAQMMKAKLRKAPNAAQLEEEYEAAANATATSMVEPEVIVLDGSDHRMLAGSRKGEVWYADGRRARERGQLEENEDMSIEDMVRQERRTKHQPGGEGKMLAERIARDAKFDDNLEYLDENAAKLARRMHKSEINLRNTAIGDLQRINRALDRCPLCHHEDAGKPPVAPVVSLATRTFLTLPTEPEVSPGGAMIVPIQHRKNLLECDDDEWEETRNFMKCLTRLYASRSQAVIFYENAAHPSRFPHAAMTAVPLPLDVAEMAPAFFKEAILTSDEEWSQHKKIIDTLTKAREGGFGRAAFRKSVAKEMPYFHVWFALDGGIAHIIEDAARWPRGDLFARETIGGMLDVGPEITRRQGRWHAQPRPDDAGTADARVRKFREEWKGFDWTGVLEG